VSSQIPLKRVAHLEAGQSPPSEEIEPLSGGVPFLQGNAEFGAVNPSSTLQCHSPRKVCVKGDILTSVRAPVGALNIANQAYGIGRGLCAVRPLKVDRQFTWWWLHSRRTYLDSVATGSTYKAITSEELGNVPFPDFDLEEQRRIADFLDAETSRIGYLRKLKSRQIRIMGEQHAARMDEVLCKHPDFAYCPLFRLVDENRPIQYGIVLPGPNYEGGVPILKGGDVAAGRLDPGRLSRTDPEIDHVYHRSRIEEDDLVMTIRGGVGEVVRVPAILNGTNLTQDTARIAPVGVEVAWLEAVLSTPSVQGQISSMVTGATIKGINIESLRRVSIPTPGRSEQVSLGNWAAEQKDRLIDSVGKIGRTVDLLAERRQALITAAVTGQLDVTTARSGVH
jgi:type I restriction enzyme S subunit